MEKQYDFSSMQKTFFRHAKCIEFEVIDFRMSSDWELTNLPSPKTLECKYTATFFCTQLDKCFFYKVIFEVPNVNILADKNFRQRLEVGARTMYQIKKKTKNPFKYLKDINLYPIDNTQK